MNMKNNKDNTIKTIAVLGAGAIGAYLLYGLNEQYKENLWVIAEGERADRLRKEGLIINEVPFAPHVLTPEEAQGADLLIVCVKYGALQGVLPMIRKAADEHTTVISLLNGVDSEDIISEVIPREQILPAIIRIASTHKGNHITFPLPGEGMGIIYGLPETAGEKSRNRLEAVKTCFENSRLESHVSSDIRRDIWLKFALNISQNIPQAIIGAGVGVYAQSEHAAFLCRAMRKEVEELADTFGIDIHIPDDRVLPHNAGTPKSARYSTLQDLDAKRPTEIDMFCKTVMRLAAEKGVSVPYNTFAYHVIKALEEKNEGKFQF